MNAAVRAATAVCLTFDVPIYAIRDVRIPGLHDPFTSAWCLSRHPITSTSFLSVNTLLSLSLYDQGYSGLIKGGESVQRLSWQSISDILHKVKADIYNTERKQTESANE